MYAIRSYYVSFMVCAMKMLMVHLFACCNIDNNRGNENCLRVMPMFQPICEECISSPSFKNPFLHHERNMDSKESMPPFYDRNNFV